MASKPACKLYIVLVVISILSWIASLIVGGVFMSDGYEDLDNDVNNETRHEEENEFEITPASWAFSIWFVIYVWQALFFLYCVLSIFERFDLHRVPMAVFPFYILNNLCGAGWTIVAEYNIYWAGVGLIAGLPITLYICLYISIRSLDGRECKYLLYTYMVHNAWAIYAGWTTVATLIYVGITLIHGSPGMGQLITGTIMLAVLGVELLVFCVAELTVLDRYLRHVWTHYVGLAVGVVGSLIENWDPTNRNSILTVAIAGFVACAISVKLVKMLYCERPDKPVKPAENPDDLEKKFPSVF